MSSRCTSVGLALAALAAATPVAGQAPDLRDVRSWRCDFPITAFADWLADVPEVEVVDGQEFEFYVDNVDIEAGSARLIGNVGAVDMFVVAVGLGVHFTEITSSGNLTVTTIYSEFVEGRGFKAVHARQITLLGIPRPSQNYGFCLPWD